MSAPLRSIAVESSCSARQSPLPNFEQTLPEHRSRRAARRDIRMALPPRRLELARRVKRGGAALIIDYGHMRTAVGSTFQALRNHRYDDPLNAPGLADLSAHVDFEALARRGCRLGARVHGPVEQGGFSPGNRHREARARG